MSTEQRRARHRARRHAAILAAARELAEAEGWDAVTTRRLAERIEYSQPVLYSHFAGKGAIVTAVALDGFADLATELRRRAAAATDPSDAVAAVVDGYLAFAGTHPATYDAMFTETVDLRFAASDTPAELRDGFDALRAALGALSGPADLDLRTELLWSTLHGLATLTARGRLPLDTAAARRDLLLRALRATAGS